MPKKDLKLFPHTPKGKPRWWWYEERHGMRIYHDDILHDNVEFLDIPWKSVRKALERKDKK